MSLVSIVPIDTTLDTIIRGQLPDLPDETGGVVVIINNPPVEPPANKTGPPDGKPPPPTCVPVKQWKRNNNGRPWNPHSTTLPPCSETSPVAPPPTCVPVKQWKRNNDGKPWNPSSNTLPPCPETSPVAPPPCPSGLQHSPIHARQFSGGVTTLQVILTYGPSTAPVPIKQLQVTAFAIYDNEVISALGKTDNDGFVVLQFPVESGSNLLLYRLSVSMDADKYRISTSPDLSQTFLFWRLDSIPLSFEFGAGLTLTAPTFRYRFMNKATNDILNVQDRTLNSWVFAKTYVAFFNGEGSKLNAVWFPGNTTNEYFSNDARSFINIHPDHATYTSAQAHEYGHWFHYLARQRKNIAYPDVTDHFFCDPGPPNAPILALTEGFATAFGLSSLWQSRFQETSGTGTTGTTGTAFRFIGPPVSFREIEQYDCPAIPEASRNLSTDEGRVAAALRDLIDANADDNGSDPARGRGGLTDRTNILRRKVLYDPMVNNPANMEEYWSVPRV